MGDTILKQKGTEIFLERAALLFAAAILSISCSRLAPPQSATDMPSASNVNAALELERKPYPSPFGYRYSYKAASSPEWYEPIDNCGLNVAIAEAANAAANVDDTIADSCDN